jgi:hypothetical protein
MYVRHSSSRSNRSSPPFALAETTLIKTLLPGSFHSRLSLSLLFIANNKRRDVFIFTKGAKKTQLLKNKSANDFSIASKKKKKKTERLSLLRS